jgi:hypothetical protein
MIAVESEGEAFWEGLSITVHVSSPLDAQQKVRFDRFVDAWYEVGSLGGFGPGELHTMLGPLFRPDGSVQMIVDMGSAQQSALDGLIRGFGLLRDKVDVPIEKVVLGNHPDFAPVEEFPD